MDISPPFQITPVLFKLSQEIARELGALGGAQMDVAPVELRKENRIKTIQASLAIEGNTLNLDQVSDIVEGKRVMGPQQDILEVSNALTVYKRLKDFDPLSSDELLKAHGHLLEKLTPNPGKWRRRNVEVFKGDQIAHMAPQAKRVPTLMRHLFSFLSENQESTWLIKACVFHYKLEFIHPFEDGNGRIGRLWQQLLLMKEDPLLEFVSIEALIKENQEEYYTVLGTCDQAGESTEFIEFSLVQILAALKRYEALSTPYPTDRPSRLAYAARKMKANWFSRKDYLRLFPTLSSATASRDLHIGVNEKRLLREGEINQTKYKFRRR